MPTQPIARAAFPAELRVSPFVIAQNYPALIVDVLLFIASLLLFFVLALSAQGACLIPLFFMAYPALKIYARYRRLSYHFRIGCIVPAVVVQSQPLMLAAWTDLSTNQTDEFPVVKIWPTSLPPGQSRSLGSHVACVAVYYGSNGSRKWDSFSPIPARMVTRDNGALKRLEESLPNEFWLTLNEGIREILPLAPGTYPVQANVKWAP